MKITVIGGSRGLGKWIAIYLISKGFDVIITSRDPISGQKIAARIKGEYHFDNQKAASQSKIVIIAVPIDNMESVIKEVAPSMVPGSLLIDVSSVKEMPAYLMQETIPEGVDFLPMHPMFGPRVRSLEGQVIVLTPLIKSQWYYKVLKFLEKEKAKILVTSPKKHDKMMSVVQVLTHFTYISIASTMEKMGVDIKESRKFASPIYNLMVDTISRIVAQNPYLAYSIQTHNKYAPISRNNFIKTAENLKKDLDHQDKEKFVKEMSSAAKNLDDLEAALGRSDKAISVFSQEITILKESIGKEVGLRHIYSGKVHVGILEELKPDFLKLKVGKKTIKLKIANIEVLDSSKLWNWKIKNLESRKFDISAVFPSSSNADVIASALEKVEGVISVKVMDIYQGPSIDPDMISITFRIKVLDISRIKEVQDLIKGFGSKIR